MKPKELLYSHRYSEAVEAYRQEMRANPDKNLYSAIGQALLADKQYHEALENFKRSNEIESNSTKGLFPSLINIGAALWLIGIQEEAMLEWHRTVAGILDGRIHYADAAGGASQGLLLWYAAVTLDDAGEREYALNYLRKLRERNVYGKAILWPRPVMLMVLGERLFTDVLKQVAGASELTESLARINGNLLERRQVCQILFYAGCMERSVGNEAACLLKMKACYGLDNPIIEVEWYLARGECESAGQNAPTT